MKIKNEKNNDLMQNPFLLKDMFLKNGLIEVDRIYYNTVADRFSLRSSNLNFPINEYYTTVNLSLCLSYLLPSLSIKEIEQIVSMFKFHHDLFCKPIKPVQIHHIIITEKHITFSTDVLYLQIHGSTVEIAQNCSFFEDQYTLKKITVDEFQKIIAKQMKKSLTLYFNKKVKKIDSFIINKVCEETLEQYDERINHKPFLKKWTDNEFYKNLKQSNINYKLVNRDDHPNIYSKNEDFKNNELILLKHDEDENIIDLEKISSRITMFISINNTKAIRKILTPIFKDTDLSYLLSILSTIDFIDKLNNPYSNEIILTIEKEPKKQFDKADAFDAGYAINISFNEFHFDIGRETELTSYNLYAFSCKDDDFKIIYINLVDFVKKLLVESLDIYDNDIKNQHIILHQMKKS